MKNPILIANWKMCLTREENLKLAEKILKDLKTKSSTQKRNIVEKLKLDIVFCPSFTYLSDIGDLIFKARCPKEFNLALGAQDVFWEEKGAFTGETSALMLKELGCQYVIVGHSEKREYLKETDEMVHRKIKACLEQQLIPILCVGETFEERQLGQKDVRIITQVTKALGGIRVKESQSLIIAYEPVWVIGSGQSVNPEEAEHAHRVIRQTLIDLWYPVEVIEKNFRIIYGGSVDSKTVKSFIDQPTVDGVLVGSASLKAEEFIKMIQLISDYEKF